MRAAEVPAVKDAVALAIAYNSVRSADCALEVYHSLHKALKDELRFSVEVFGPEELIEIEEKNEAHQIRKSDLLIVGLDPDRPVPTAVRTLVRDAALAHKTGGPGAIVLVLSQSARHSGLSGGAEAALEVDSGSTDETNERETSFIFVDKAIDGWGIND
jgi:hypothetical protein